MRLEFAGVKLPGRRLHYWRLQRCSWYLPRGWRSVSRTVGGDIDNEDDFRFNEKW